MKTTILFSLIVLFDLYSFSQLKVNCMEVANNEGQLYSHWNNKIQYNDTCMRINLISLTNDSIVSLNSAQNEYIVVPSISPTSILVIQKHSLFKQDTLSQSIDTLTLKHLDWPRIELFAGNTTNGQILDLGNLELRVGYKEEINSCIDFKSRIFKTTLFIPSTNQSFFLTGNQFTEEIIALFNTLDSGTKIELSTISSCNKLTRASFYLP